MVPRDLCIFLTDMNISSADSSGFIGIVKIEDAAEKILAFPESFRAKLLKLVVQYNLLVSDWS
jgi:hypothetical protein